MDTKQSLLAQVGTALGVGLIAGVAGTAAMTLSKKLDKKTTDERKSEKVGLELASKVLDVKPTSEEKTDKVVEEIHWGYGACWGMLRGLLSFIGMRGPAASTVHLASIWYAEKVCIPDLKKVFPDVKPVPPVTEEQPEEVIRESLHIAVYAFVTGLVYDMITKSK